MIGILYFLPAWEFRGKGGAGADLAFAEVTRGWQSDEMSAATNDLAKVSFRQSHWKRYSRRSERGSAAAAGLVSAEAPIEVFLGVGEHLDRFRTPFSPKTAFPGRGWVIEDMGQLHLEGTEAEITWRLLRSGTRRVISYHWYEENRGLFEESVRSIFALDRSPFARELPVMVVRIATQVDDVTARELKRVHHRLTAFHGLVASAIDVMKARFRGYEGAETSDLPNFPLWEIFFPSLAIPATKNINEIHGLSTRWAVA